MSDDPKPPLALVEIRNFSLVDEEPVQELVDKVLSGELDITQAARLVPNRDVKALIAELAQRYELSSDEQDQLRQARITHGMLSGDASEALKAVELSQHEVKIRARKTSADEDEASEEVRRIVDRARENMK